MKAMIPITASLCFLRTASLVASEEKVPASIDEQFLQVDCSVAVKQYEKIEQLIADARLDLALLSARTDATVNKDREALNKRIDILKGEAHDAQDCARHYSEEISKHQRKFAVRF